MTLRKKIEKLVEKLRADIAQYEKNGDCGEGLSFSAGEAEVLLEIAIELRSILEEEPA